MIGKRTLIVSAHADDESFGMGGTLSRLSNTSKTQLYWLILTMPWQPKWSKHAISQRASAILKVNEQISFSEVIKWDYKDNLLDSVSKNELQERFIALIDRIKPNTIFTPSLWDYNFEHKLTYEMVESCSKHYYSDYLESIFTYEIPSSTESSFSASSCFLPNFYVDIGEFMTTKIVLINAYETELKSPPHPRSEEYIKSLAIKRGGEVGLEFAEAFHLLRGIVK